MQATKLRPATRRGGVIWLPVDELEPSPVQPRKNFSDGELKELSDSIAQYGVLNPLTVRLRDNRYELVAGERRLRAARLAGLYDVPCILLDVSLEDASLIALVENLQRKDLDFIEEANGLSQLIKLFGMSQEEAARRIGKSQSAVANKLRLLRLPGWVQEIVEEGQLSERHARAVLKLKDEEVQLAVIKRTAEKNLSVKDTERLVEKTLDKMYDEKRPGAAPRPAIIRQVRDYRLFMNTVNSAIAVLRESGMNVEVEQEDLQNGVDIHIRITNE